MDEKNAISRLKQGDPGGLEFLVRDYQVRAVYTAYMIVNDHSLAEEVAQTAFVRVAERFYQFDENRPFAPWFFRIVTNEAIKVARRQRRVAPLNDDLDDAANTLVQWLTDPHPSPEKLVELKEKRLDVLAALRCLQPEQRAVVVMRYFLEMSEADMSERMERPISTIKWWLRAARERLRSLLQSSSISDDRE